MAYIDRWAYRLPARPQQKQALEWVDANPDVSTLLINAATGIGKSQILTTLGEADGGIILTPLKQLQDQYQRDWPDMPLLKGRQNYACHKFTGADCKSGSAAGCNGNGCPYKAARDRFFGARAAVTNYAWLFSSMQQPEFELPAGNWLLMDEAHCLEENLIGAATIKVTLDIIKLLEFHDAWPTSLETAVPYMEGMLTVLSVRVVQLAQECNVGGESISPDMAHNLAKLQMLSEAINYFLESHTAEEWVFSDDINLMSFTIRPLTAKRLYTMFMEPLGRRIMMASATLPEPRLLERWIGIAGASRLELPSPFDVANRTVRFAPAGNMSKGSLQDTLPHMANRLIRLLDTYRDCKGIIHSHSFKLAEQLSTMMRHHTSRMLVHSRDSDRQALVEHHIRSTEPTVLISPSMTEGLDLHDDLSRFTIFVKTPYPYLGDAFVKARMEEDGEWYAWQTMRAIIQGAGRSVRNASDWADTWILDAGFLNFWSRSHYLAPKWFADSVKMGGITP